VTDRNNAPLTRLELEHMERLAPFLTVRTIDGELVPAVGVDRAYVLALQTRYPSMGDQAAPVKTGNAEADAIAARYPRTVFPQKGNP
jgi:hypothetical protein